QFHDFSGGIAPVFEVCTYAQRTNDAPHLRLELFDRVVVEVIPMVVCDDQVVDVGHVRYMVARRARKTFRGKRHRRCVAVEYRVNQYFFAVYLHEIRRVAKPDEYIGLCIKLVKVGFDGRNGIYRHMQGCIFKEEAPQYGEHINPFGQIGGVFKVLKATVFIVGRVFDPLKPVPLRCPAEGWLTGKYNDPRNEYRTGDKQAKQHTFDGFLHAVYQANMLQSKHPSCDNTTC